MNWITIAGVILIALGTILTFVGQNKSNREDTSKLSSEIQEKNQEIDNLVEGNQKLQKGNKELLSKIDKYQSDLTVKEKEIETLKTESIKSRRGITSSFDFNGVRREGKAGSLNTIIGDEVNVFQELASLEKEQNFPELIKLATNQIEKTPEWLTPYLFRGIAYLNSREIKKAKADLEHVVKYSAGDPAYAQATQTLDKINNK